MNLVDSCGWLEYFADGPNASFFASAITDVEKLLIPSICVLEVFKRVLQQRGENLALQVVAVMHQGQIVDLDGELSISAARLGHELKLPLADSVILATARRWDAMIWTQDAHFEHVEGVRYIRKS